MRTRDTVTEDEIAELESKYLGEDLPTDGGASWVFTGFCYQDENSSGNERCYEHPNREFLIKRYLEDINSEVGDFNRDVQKEWREDLNRFEELA